MVISFTPNDCIMVSCKTSGNTKNHCGKYLQAFIISLCLSFQKGRVIRGAYRFQAVITTFEMILGGCPELNAIDWRCVIIDEAHRLKNKNCKLLEGFKLMSLVQMRRYYSYINTFSQLLLSNFFLNVISLCRLLGA